MVRKAILTSSITILFSIVLSIIYFIAERIAQKKAIVEKIQTLSSSSLFTLDSVQFNISSPKFTVLVYFNSECEHCQYELSEIKKNMRSFQSSQLLLISSENISEIKKVAVEFDFTNAVFLKINREDVFEKFGALSVPHLLLYSSDQKLIKEFKGETKIETILQYLPK